jgi:hypothetical protein
MQEHVAPGEFVIVEILEGFKTGAERADVADLVPCYAYITVQ